jgi:hypothetical protein
MQTAASPDAARLYQCLESPLIQIPFANPVFQELGERKQVAARTACEIELIRLDAAIESHTDFDPDFDTDTLLTSLAILGNATDVKSACIQAISCPKFLHELLLLFPPTTAFLSALLFKCVDTVESARVVFALHPHITEHITRHVVANGSCKVVEMFLTNAEFHESRLTFIGFLEACKVGRIDMVRLFVRYVRHNSNLVQDGINLAAKRGYVDIVRLLLEYCCMLNNDIARLCIDICDGERGCERGCERGVEILRVLQLLVEHHPRFDPSMFNNVILQFARCNGGTELERILMADARVIEKSRRCEEWAADY